MKKILLTAAFSVIMCFEALAFTSNNPEVTIKSGDTGRTYTWTSPLGTEITMPVITKDAVLSVAKADDENYAETYFYDPSGAITQSKDKFMFGYKNSAFAIATLSLYKQTDYSPVNISHYNYSDPILTLNRRGYQGQDVIIGFYKNILPRNKVRGWDFEGAQFTEENAGRVGYFYVDMSGSAPAQSTQSQGWESSDRGWKYKDSNGSFISNTWKQIDGVWYFFDSQGSMITGWRQINGTWYFFNDKGAMLTGWVKDGNTWYYMNPSGAMLTGWVQTGNDWYFMNASGAMLSNTTTADGYKLDASGKMVK